MDTNLKVYLAGPDVFAEDAQSYGSITRELCRSFGFESLLPSDNEMRAAWGDRGLPIYRANISLLQAADLAIFNLTPFRGPSADVGTVFELGYLVSRGVPIYGYTNSLLSYLDRIDHKFDPDIDSYVDESKNRIEDFGNADNLMVEMALLEAGHAIIRIGTSQDRFIGLKLCLDIASKDFGSQPMRLSQD